MPLAAIARYVNAFPRFAAIHGEMTFHVTRIGCAAGGYRDDEIAPLLAGAPPNCHRPKGRERLIKRCAAEGPDGDPEPGATGKPYAIRDLLVSHPLGYFGRARNEVVRLLGRIGDAQPRIEKSGVPGICIVHTSVDNREVVIRCTELCRSDPELFRFAIKWVPVDFWCAKDLDAIARVIEDEVVPRIGAEQTWAMQVEKRGWVEYHTAEIIERLASTIDRKVNLKTPDKLVRIDVLRDAIAISVLRPGEVLSIHAPST